MAATLIELKAARLLPGADPESEQVEALLSERDLLFARLLQYQAYKEVAGLMARRFAAETAYHPRTAGAEELLSEIVPNLLAGVTPVDMARAAARALTPAAPPGEAQHIAPPPRLSLAETVKEMVDEALSASRSPPTGSWSGRARSRSSWSSGSWPCSSCTSRASSSWSSRSRSTTST